MHVGTDKEILQRSKWICELSEYFFLHKECKTITHMVFSCLSRVGYSVYVQYNNSAPNLKKLPFPK
jgi:hypothetical protein